MVDIPWAHARLSLAEFRRFVQMREGETRAEKACHQLETLNRFTLGQWRAVFEASAFEIRSWVVTQSSYAEEALAKNPEVLDGVLDGISRDDLVGGQIKVLARKKG